MQLPHDPLWPRAAHWLVPAAAAESPAEGDIGLLGVPAWKTSITPTGAHATPDAVRDALLRYSTYSTCRDIDVAQLTAFDFGNVAEPDDREGETRVATAVSEAAKRVKLLVAVGGDNSITYSAMRGLFAENLAACGLITVDAHHDLRDGITNGSPVRRLVEAGLPGENIVQIGIADFCNSPAYAARAQELGITVIPRAALRGSDMAAVARRALDIAGSDGRPVFVDFDVDVCDRAVTPGCPSAAPGGISADELRDLVFLLTRDARVKAVDITEIDAMIDTADQRTVRLGALLVLEAAAGLAARDKQG